MRRRAVAALVLHKIIRLSPVVYNLRAPSLALSPILLNPVVYGLRTPAMSNVQGANLQPVVYSLSLPAQTLLSGPFTIELSPVVYHLRLPRPLLVYPVSLAQPSWQRARAPMRQNYTVWLVKSDAVTAIPAAGVTIQRQFAPLPSHTLSKVPPTPQASTTYERVRTSVFRTEVVDAETTQVRQQSNETTQGWHDPTAGRSRENRSLWSRTTQEGPDGTTEQTVIQTSRLQSSDQAQGERTVTHTETAGPDGSEELDVTESKTTRRRQYLQSSNIVVDHTTTLHSVQTDKTTSPSTGAPTSTSSSSSENEYRYVTTVTLDSADDTPPGDLTAVPDPTPPPLDTIEVTVPNGSAYLATLAAYKAAQGSLMVTRQTAYTDGTVEQEWLGSGTLQGYDRRRSAQGYALIVRAGAPARRQRIGRIITLPGAFDWQQAQDGSQQLSGPVTLGIEPGDVVQVGSMSVQVQKLDYSLSPKGSQMTLKDAA